jgi:hypothetical protein
MADLTTGKAGTSGVAAKEIEVMNAQKVLLEVQTAKACVDAADKAASLFMNASMEMKLPKVCNQYLVKVPQEKSSEEKK